MAKERDETFGLKVGEALVVVRLDDDTYVSEIRGWRDLEATTKGVLATAKRTFDAGDRG